MKKLTGKIVAIVPTPFTPDSEEFTPPSMPKISQPDVQSVSGILTSLTQKDGTPLVTPVQADELSQMVFAGTDRLILTLGHRYFVYEIIWLLHEVGYDAVKNFLSQDWISLLGPHHIRKKVLFENPLLDPAREKLALDMEIFRKEVDVVKGAVDCKKCSSSETMSIEKQKRSGDEMGSIKIYCMDCGYEWYAQ